jgi:tRNA nucleotidyltransferase (CCA-adding enzyme)
MIDLEPPGAVRWICRTLEESGFDTWAVGGAVRDALAGRPGGDWDLTTAAPPNQVRRLFRRTVPIGIDHGTVGVLARDGTMYEVTTFRRDVETTGRHAVVAFAETLDEDLARRDFTINAVAWHPLNKVLHDPHGGAEDLRRGVLRTVGDPAARFAEDLLRVLRALRFAGVFRLRIEDATWRALVAAVPGTGILSAERLREELEKILSEPDRPSAALSLYAASGVTAFLYPELDALVGMPVPGRPGDRWSHALRTVDLLPDVPAHLRWAALLAGLAATEAAEELGSRPGLVRSAALLERLRSSNARIDAVAGLVDLIGAAPMPDASEADLRRWLSTAERERLPDLIRIWIAEFRADEARMGRGATSGEEGRSRADFLTLIRRLRAVARAPAPLAVQELAISGRDLIRMGYRPGPHFGELLRHLLSLVLEDPSRNEPEALAAEARRWMEEAEGEA